VIHGHCTVASFDSHEQAEAAIRRLSQAGFPLGRLSIVSQGCYTEEQVIGFYGIADRMGQWARKGALWGGLWGLLTATVSMTVAGIGPVSMLGNFGLIVTESALVVGTLAAIAAALASLGRSKDGVLRYEQVSRADEFVLVVRGTIDEARHARTLLGLADAVAAGSNAKRGA